MDRARRAPERFHLLSGRIFAARPRHRKGVDPGGNKCGLGLLPYFPLASGLLTGKYRHDAPLPEGARLTKTQRLADRYMTEANWSIVAKLRAFCEARGKTMLELAFSWLLARKPVASVIAGATRPEQIEQNVNAASWTLSAEDLAEIDKITGSGLKPSGPSLNAQVPHEVPSHPCVGSILRRVSKFRLGELIEDHRLTCWRRACRRSF